MRLVGLTLALLTAVATANPTRFRREEKIEAQPDVEKSDPSLGLELPEPGPIDRGELTGGTEEPEEKLSTPKVTTSERVATSTETSTTKRRVEEPEVENKFDERIVEEEAANVTSDIFETYPEEETVEVCDENSAPGRSKVYCSGKLLAAVNQHHLFTDSKTFVDRPMKFNRTQEQIMSDFNERFPSTIPEIDPEQLRAFVEENFEKEGQELDKCEVTDWIPNPPAFDGIQDETMRQYAHKLHDIWKELCRHIKSVVHDDPSRFSLIHVPNNFIAPGGRFREFYYWDTYWIVKGLLASGMYETTRGMLENFGTIVDKFGFIPNGGRVYYLKRSQPPLLTAMVYDYYEATRNKTFLMEMMPLLEKEFEFWRNERSIDVEMNGLNHTMFQYRSEANVPRPESYREDDALASVLPSKGRQQQFYKDIASAAESGWDFSTRWFSDHKTLLNIHTTDIVPVDLNAFVCYNLNLMSFLHKELGNFNNERSWLNDYNAFKVSFREVFYKQEARGWYDFNIKEGQHNTAFFPSMAVPLFTGCFDKLSLTESGDLLDRMVEMGALDYPAGIPTSLANHTQEQWDFPNGWSPLNHMVIEGLRKSDNPRLQQAAFKLAQKWVRANLNVFNSDHAMWEKYNVASNKGRGGGGGEYEVQAGFGWSNGVVLDLLLTYGDRLTAGEELEAASSSSTVSSSPSPSTVPQAAGRTAAASSPVTSAIGYPTVFHSLLIAIVSVLANRW